MNITQMVEIVHLNVKLTIHGMVMHVYMMTEVVENVIMLFNSMETEER
jgi:hypothetical protein